MLIYIMDERKTLDSDSIRNNKNLKTLIKLRLDYKIPLLILLTHSDNYCDEVKKTEKNWKEICKSIIINNKKVLLKYINEELIGENTFKMEEKDIIHTVLIEPKKMTDEEIIESLDPETKEEFDKASDNEKKLILRMFMKGKVSTENEVPNFLKK